LRIGSGIGFACIAATYQERPTWFFRDTEKSLWFMGASGTSTPDVGC
jgi:hypothetical protein